jgi:hypothetical protein
LADIFGYKGTNNTVYNLIKHPDKTTQLENHSLYIQSIIDKLGDGKNLPNISDKISFEDFISGIKKWRKMTTTSPSGRHLGHYKILLKLNVINDNNINISSAILHLHNNIIRIVSKLGQTLDRWCQISTCMIEKKPGVIRIDKLRVIHLYESDYNLLLKIMWARRSIWNMVDNKSINSGQVGSRPGHRAIDLVLQKEMMYTYAHITRTY